MASSIGCKENHFALLRKNTGCELMVILDVWEDILKKKKKTSSKSSLTVTLQHVSHYRSSLVHLPLFFFFFFYVVTTSGSAKAKWAERQEQRRSWRGVNVCGVNTVSSKWRPLCLEVYIYRLVLPVGGWSHSRLINLHWVTLNTVFSAEWPSDASAQ